MPSWKKVILSGSNATLNSLSVSTSVTASVVSSSNGFTGSLLGTASFVTGSIHVGSNLATSASFSITSSFGQTSFTASFVTGSIHVGSNVATSASFAATSSFAQTSFTASFVTGSIFVGSNIATSASFAVSAAWAPGGAGSIGGSGTTNRHAKFTAGTTIGNSLIFDDGTNLQITGSTIVISGSNTQLSTIGNISVTGSVIISGSNSNLLLGGNVTASTEACLIIGIPPNGVSAGEGGQIILQAPNSGGYTSASMLDNYQNLTRLLRGNNTASDAVVASFNMHTKQIQFPAYNGASAFVGTAAANLAVDVSGNVITVSTSGGTVFPYTGTAVITGSLVVSNAAGNSGAITASGAIISLANGAMYFRGGDDAELWDINVANTVGVYGQQDQGIGGIKFGSGGGTLTGRSGSIGIGTITPSSNTNLDVVGVSNISGSLLVTGSARFTGSVIATQGGFTGSLFGTSSFTQTAFTASFVTGSIFVGTNPAATASFVTGSVLFGTNQAVSSSFSLTSSFSQTAFTASFVTGSIHVGSNAATSASFATTASFAQTSFTASFVTGSIFVGTNPAATASFVTGSVFVGSNLATSASFAVSAAWAPGGAGSIGGSGTTNRHAKFTAGTTIGDSLIFDDGTNLQITGSTIVVSGSAATVFVTGSVRALGGFTGSLLGTASFVTGSIFVGTNTARSASFALTASFAVTNPTSNKVKAGRLLNTDFTGNPKKGTVTLVNVFPDLNYSVAITGEDARTWTIESKATNSFVVNSNSNTVLAGTTYWVALSYGEL